MDAREYCGQLLELCVRTIGKVRCRRFVYYHYYYCYYYHYYYYLSRHECGGVVESAPTTHFIPDAGWEGRGEEKEGECQLEVVLEEECWMHQQDLTEVIPCA